MMYQNDEQLIQIVYASTATCILTDDELKALLRSSREYNQEHGITGMLLHQHGNYMQAMEGPTSAVDKLYEVVVNDPRHFDIICLYREKRNEREFADWSMAFRNVDNESIEGFSVFLRPGKFEANLEIGRTNAKKLFRRFREITQR